MMDALASCVCVWSAARTGEAAGPSHDVSGCLALRLERQAVLQATGEARHRAPQRTVVPAHPSDESLERRVCGVSLRSVHALARLTRPPAR